MSEKLCRSHQSLTYTYAKKKAVLTMNFVEYVIISAQIREKAEVEPHFKKYQSIYYCCLKQKRLFLLFVQTRTLKHKKSVACVYTDEHGLN